MYGFQPAARRHAQQPEKPQRFAAGGIVRGPGTGTSDSIETEVEPGTFIMPADSTQAIGPEALAGMGKVPVRLSDGEFEVPPEQAMALGIAVLKAMKDATHAPVNGQDGGQTDEEVAQARGFTPAAARDTRAPVARLFADGGAVGMPARPNSFGDASAAAADPSVTRVNTGGSDTFGRAAATPAPAPSSAPIAAPAPSSAAGFQPSSARMNAFTDPRSTMYDTNPNAAANARVMSNYAASIGSRGLMEQGMPQSPAPATARNSFGDAAAATLDPTVSQMVTGFQPASQRPAPMPMAAGVGGFQPRSYADGGVVTDEDRRQGLVSQIPTGGMFAPPADGSQNNPLNTEVGRNALNTLSALPGASGFASRSAATTARGIGGATAAVERAAPATWEVVEGGASAARAAAPTGGALTRAASVAPDISATGFSSRTAQMLGSPGGQVAERAASEVGQAAPAAGRGARGFTPYADVVEPLALSAPSASQAAGAAAQGARGFGPMAAAGGAAGLGAASLVSGDSSAGSPPAAAPSTPGVTSAISAPPRAQAADAPMGPPISASNSITRDGNSYSGPANLSGDVSIRNPDGSLRQSGGTVTSLPAGAQFGGGQGLAAAALGGTLPGGGISAQSMGAADALAAQSQTDSMGRLLASGQIRAPQAGPSMILPGGSFGIRRANSVVSGEQDARRAFDYATGNDPASRARQAALQQTALKEQGDTQREIIKAEGLGMREMLKARQSGKAPEGYRWTSTGGLEAIPGGPAAAKVADQQQTKEAGFDATRQTIGTINRLLANTNGLQGATGMIGVQRFFPGTDAADFASQVETLKAQTFLPMVQQLRGMGALSNAEGDKLNAAVGALNFNMSEKAFGESLGRIRDQLSGALQRAGIDTKGASTWGLQPPSTVAEQGQGGQPTAAPAAQRSVTRMGMANGRRVAQYSDGSIEYAD